MPFEGQWPTKGVKPYYDELTAWSDDLVAFVDNLELEIEQGGGGGGPVAWVDVTGKPAEFPPGPHGHVIADVAGLDTALAAKAAATDLADFESASTIAMDALSDVVATKAAESDLAALTAIVGNKANATDVATSLSAKANTVDVNNALAGKASASDLDNTFETATRAEGKADAAQVDADAALTAASDAQADADAALTAAGTAQSNASTALTNASTALGVANDALASVIFDGVLEPGQTPPGPGIYVRKPAVAFVGAFDTFSAPYRAHSLRRVLSSYTGPLLKVRRSSDNTTAEIGYNADGSLNTTALLSFVGAGDGFVETFYDQGANGRHLTQATAANQPRIVSAGVVDAVTGKPAIVFDGVSDLLISPTAGLYAATTATVAFVMKSNSNSVANATVFSESRTANNNGFWRALRGSTTSWNVQATDDAGVALWASSAAGSNLFDLNQHQGIYIEGAGVINTWKDNVAVHAALAATRAGATTPTQTVLGAHSGSAPSSFYNGTIQELVAWPTAQTASRAAIQTAQKGFWGTP